MIKSARFKYTNALHYYLKKLCLCIARNEILTLLYYSFSFFFLYIFLCKTKLAFWKVNQQIKQQIVTEKNPKRLQSPWTLACAASFTSKGKKLQSVSHRTLCIEQLNDVKELIEKKTPPKNTTFWLPSTKINIGLATFCIPHYAFTGLFRR